MTSYRYNSSALTQLNSRAYRGVNVQALIDDLEECQEDANMRAKIHNRSGLYFGQRDKALRLPLLLLTTINSVIGATALFNKSYSIVYVVFGIGLLVTIFTAVNNFYGYRGKMEQNHTNGFLLKKISRKIRYFLLQNTYNPKNATEVAEFVEKIQQNFDEILDKRVYPPLHIVNAVEKEEEEEMKKASPNAYTPRGRFMSPKYNVNSRQTDYNEFYRQRPASPVDRTVVFHETERLPPNPLEQSKIVAMSIVNDQIDEHPDGVSMIV